MRVTRSLLLAAAILAALPGLARAQAAITGTVKDTSGAVLPGVAVEATSPALIEKVRSAVTDGTGQYRIVDLRPGNYSVTFSLQGFSSVKRDGIELTGTFTASIRGESCRRTGPRRSRPSFHPSSVCCPRTSNSRRSTSSPLARSGGTG
jgi:hypothetical protein